MDIEKTLGPTIAVVLKQSGLGLLVAIAFGYALRQVYADLSLRNELLVELVRTQTAAQQKHIDVEEHQTELLVLLSDRLRFVKQSESKSLDR